MLYKKEKVFSAGSCVYKIEGNNASIILIKSRISKSWGIPKGHVEEGETLRETAVRETYEESGVTVTLEDALTVVTTKNRREKKDVHAWLAQQTCDSSPTMTNNPDNEVVEVRWHCINDLPIIHKYQQPLISEAIDIIKSKM